MHIRSAVRRCVHGLALTGCLVVASVGFAGSAAAEVEGYCIGGYGPFDTCRGPRHTLTGNAVTDLTGDYRVCAGAFSGADPSVFYGSYFCANGSACHDYNTLLYPAAHNGEGFVQTLYGVFSYGPDTLSDCPRGG